MGKGLKALASHWKVFAVAAGAATAAVVAFAAKAIQAASEQGLAEAKLLALLGNVRDERDKTIDSLKAQAEALQKVTKFEDAEILNAQAMLASFQLTKKQIAEITPRMLDMAASLESVSGQQANLQQVSIALGKGFTGMVGQLGRYGVILSDATKKSGDFSAIIADLDMNFKGAAIAAADTFGGKLTILKNQFGEVMEEIGKIITKNETLKQALIGISNTFSEVAGYIGENADAISKYIGQMVVNVVKAFNKLIKGWAVFDRIVGRVSTDMGRVIGIFNKNWREAAATVEEENKKSYQAMMHLAGGIDKFAEGLQVTVGEVGKFAGVLAGPDTPNIAAGAKKAATELEHVIEMVNEIYKVAGMPADVEIKIIPPGGTKPVEAFGKAVNDMGKQIEAAASHAAAAFGDMFGRIVSGAEGAKVTFKDFLRLAAQIAGMMIGGPGGAAIGGFVGGIFHEGGMIDKGAPIPVPIGVLDRLPRAHRGLSADERLIVGRRGEGVLNEVGVAGVGGASGLDALNKGQMPGGRPVVIEQNFYISTLGPADMHRALRGELGRAMREVSGEGVPIMSPKGVQ